MLATGWDEAEQVLLGALRELVAETRATIPGAFGYASADNGPDSLHVESVLLVGDPNASGTDQGEVVIVCEAISLKTVPWLGLYLEEPAEANRLVMHLSIESPTGGWERILTPIVLPGENADGNAKSSAEYATRAVQFLAEHKPMILRYVGERAREIEESTQSPEGPVP